jgi:outer membrane receptor for ferrienterochelin and colicins
LHYTRLRHMAFDQAPPIPHSEPIKFMSSSETFNVVVYELLAGVKPTAQWFVEGGVEFFNYDELYQRRLPTAALEQRVTVKSQYDWGDKYSWNVVGVWVGDRDLSAYDVYPDHYNVYAGGLFGASSPKWQRSPAFWVWNTSVSRKIKNGEMILGVDNLFNYTQTGRGDSPAMWHFHGGHAHFDNRHLWGPNRGAEWYVRLSLDF